MDRKFPLKVAHTFWSPVILWISGITLNSSGQENLDTNKTYIFMMNHLSVMDISCACNAIPHPLHFVGKKSLRNIPFLGWYMIIMGMIFIDRSNNKKSIESLQKAGELIKSGRSVIIFPEGTRSKTGELCPFKKGGFYLALNSGIDVVPVYINGTQNCWKSGSMKVKGGAKVKLRIGKPIPTNKFSKETIGEFIKETEEKVKELSAV